MFQKTIHYLYIKVYEIPQLKLYLEYFISSLHYFF